MHAVLVHFGVKDHYINYLAEFMFKKFMFKNNMILYPKLIKIRSVPTGLMLLVSSMSRIAQIGQNVFHYCMPLE